MSTEVVADVVIRPIRDSDAEALGRVHAQCWHEDYDTLVSAATLENLSPRRMAELWTHWVGQGDDFTHVAALVDSEIVGFAGAGPARDDDAPRERELFFIHLLDSHHGHGIGQKLSTPPWATSSVYLWVPAANSTRCASTNATDSRPTASRTTSRSSARRSTRSGWCASPTALDRADALTRYCRAPTAASA